MSRVFYLFVELLFAGVQVALAFVCAKLPLRFRDSR